MFTSACMTHTSGILRGFSHSVGRGLCFLMDSFPGWRLVTMPAGGQVGSSFLPVLACAL